MPMRYSSAAYYLGYAEDGESVEAIMKKFEELEKFQKEVSCQDSPKVASSSVSMNCTEIGASQDGADAVGNFPGQETLFIHTGSTDYESISA